MMSENTTAANKQNISTVNSNSSSFLLFNYFVTENPWIVHTGAGVTYLVILLNSFVIYVLMKKENKTVSTLPLVSLAISDTFTAICHFLPKHYGFLFDQLERQDIFYSDGVSYVRTKYPFCIFYVWTFITYSVSFHSISIAVTAFLSIQKAIVLLFPIKSKLFFTKNLIMMIIVTIWVIIVCLFIPIGLVYDFSEDQGMCAFTNNKIASEYFGKVFPIAASALNLSSLCAMFFSTIYISVKLTCLRNSPKAEATPFTNTILQRAALVVVLVTLTFILFDSMYIVCSVHLAMTQFQDYSLCAHKYWQYNGLINVLGFSTNYFIYLAVSQNIRKQMLEVMKAAVCL